MTNDDSSQTIRTWRANDGCRGRTDMLMLIAVTCIWLVGIVGCEQPSGSRLPTVTMPIGSRSFTLEMATAGSARTRGLMYRESMALDHGMIFCFSTEQPMSFWMHNTRIPLDIIYLDHAGKIVSIKPMQPMIESPSIDSDGPAKYAIEINQGMAISTGIKPGDTVQLPAQVTRAPADPY